MKHNFTKAAIVAACLLGVAGLAQADTRSDDFDVIVHVPVVCSLQPFAQTILNIDPAITTASSTVNLIAHCSYLTPFQVQLYTSEVGGKLDVTDAGTNRDYQVLFTKPSNGTLYGRIADGEALSAIGTGEWQAVDANVSFNADGGYGRPQQGQYIGTLVAEMVF